MKIDYIELASSNITATTSFLKEAFGWGMVDYGPSYQAFEGAGIDGGVDGSGETPPQALIILKTDDLEAALQTVAQAGAEILKPIYPFPGGRRFHFREPGGTEMAIWSET